MSGSPSVRVLRVEGAPVVAVRVILPGGARLETIPGQALITGRTLSEGTLRRDWRTLAEAAESLGMTPASFGALEAHGVAVDALAGDAHAALALAAELLFEPAFPEERVRWIARQAAGELEAQADQADLLTARAFADLLYAPHPKGRPAQGSAESLARLAADDCRRFHAEALARGGIVVVSGAIDEREIAAAAEELFRQLPPPTRATAEPAPPPPSSARRREIVTRAEDQAHLFLGQLSVTRTDPDFEALELASVILGAGPGLSGRIPQRIRDKEGLAYHVSADAVGGAGLDAGRLLLYAGTDEEQVERAERAMREELERFVAEGVSETELDEARSYLVGREPFRRESARQWADLVVQSMIVGLPLDDPELRLARLAAVDRAAVETAVRRHVDPAKLCVVVGLPRG